MTISIFFMLIIHFIEKFYYLLTSLLSEKKCIICGKSHSDLCFVCQNKIFERVKINFFCRRCGRPLTDDFKICINCLNRPIFFELKAARSLTVYGKNQQTFIYHWKFNKKRMLGITAAFKLYDVYKKLYKSIPVVPVPPRKKTNKIEEMNYDCVKDIAFIFRFCFNVKIIEPLIRIDSEEQKYKSFANRIDKSKKRYALKKNHQINSRSVVILDDIMTTGATLEECALLLTSAGVENVYAITLFCD